MFLENSQNSQENTCARVSFSIKFHLVTCQVLVHFLFKFFYLFICFFFEREFRTDRLNVFDIENVILQIVFFVCLFFFLNFLNLLFKKIVNSFIVGIGAVDFNSTQQIISLRSEAVAWRCSVKMVVFLEISQNSQENICA